MYLKDLIETLEARDFDISSATKSHNTFVRTIADRLWEINGKITLLKRDLAANETMVKVWKESYLDQVKENVKLQAKQLAENINA